MFAAHRRYDKIEKAGSTMIDHTEGTHMHRWGDILI